MIIHIILLDLLIAFLRLWLIFRHQNWTIFINILSIIHVCLLLFKSILLWVFASRDRGRCFDYSICSLADHYIVSLSSLVHWVNRYDIIVHRRMIKLHYILYILTLTYTCIASLVVKAIVNVQELLVQMIIILLQLWLVVGTIVRIMEL